MTGRLPDGFYYSCAGALIAPQRLRWSHNMARYTVGQLMAELHHFQPQVLVFWDGAGLGIQFFDVTLVEAMLRDHGIRDENQVSPFLLAIPCPGWAVLAQNPRAARRSRRAGTSVPLTGPTLV